MHIPSAHTAALATSLVLVSGCLNGTPADDRRGSAGDDTAEDDDTSSEDGGFVESRSAIVAITAPNWGYDLGLDGDVITLEGVAREDVVAVSWSTASGGGEATGVAAWIATDIALARGDNVITVTGITGDGEVGTASMVVASTPGVPLASNLTLSGTIAWTGEERALEAGL
jgi:hypothetical protein